MIFITNTLLSYEHLTGLRHSLLLSQNPLLVALFFVKAELHSASAMRLVLQLQWTLLQLCSFASVLLFLLNVLLLKKSFGATLANEFTVTYQNAKDVFDALNRRAHTPHSQTREFRLVTGHPTRVERGEAIALGFWK